MAALYPAFWALRTCEEIKHLRYDYQMDSLWCKHLVIISSNRKTALSEGGTCDNRGCVSDNVTKSDFHYLTQRHQTTLNMT